MRKVKFDFISIPANSQNVPKSLEGNIKKLMKKWFFDEDGLLINLLDEAHNRLHHTAPFNWN